MLIPVNSVVIYIVVIYYVCVFGWRFFYLCAVDLLVVCLLFDCVCCRLFDLLFCGVWFDLLRGGFVCSRWYCVEAGFGGWGGLYCWFVCSFSLGVLFIMRLLCLIECDCWFGCYFDGSFALRLIVANFVDDCGLLWL